MGDPAQFQGRIIFMSMFNDVIWGSTDNERECIANATLVTLFAKRFPAGRCSFLGLESEKKLYSTYIDRPRGEWDRVAELMMLKIRRKRTPSFPSHESKGHSGRNLIDPSPQDNVLIPPFSSSTFIILDVQSVYTPSHIQD